MMIADAQLRRGGLPEQLKSLKLGLDGMDIGEESSDERPPLPPDEDRIHVRRPLRDICVCYTLREAEEGRLPQRLPRRERTLGSRAPCN